MFICENTVNVKDNFEDGSVLPYLEKTHRVFDVVALLV